MRVMMVIAYDGSKFHGFQRQNNVNNVQGYLEEALSKLLKENITIKGAGRTDAKVHAKYQVVHFDTTKKVFGIKKVLNSSLNGIKIKKVKIVNEDFHARYSVKSKTYVYKIDLSGKKDPNYYLRIPYNIDIKKIKKASKIFLGTHDFRNFVSGEREDYTSTILNINVYRINNVLCLKFKGIGFYRYMVRNLVGALIEVGKGKISEEDIKYALDNPNEKRNFPTSLPNGLYLYKINY